jgi:hypothetical protein
MSLESKQVERSINELITVVHIFIPVLSYDLPRTVSA